ncbi:MAG: lactonase family protein [Bacteroidales bacterium]|nr:lactonase family protein [Bacteroidales bacterium]
MKCLAILASAVLRLLVGTYTEGTGAEGVYLYEFNEETLDSQLLSAAPAGNPSFVIASPDGRFAYSVNEFHDGREGVSAYSIHGDEIRRVDSLTIPRALVDGSDPCNLLLLDNVLVSSNYTGGSLTAFRLTNKGAFNGIAQYTSFSANLYNRITGEDKGTEDAHMHCAVVSPDGKYVFATNLGNDCIHRFALREGDFPLGECEVAWRNIDYLRLSKLGPRHMVFSADGRFAYLLGELGDRLVVFSYSDGALEPIQSIKAYSGRGHGSADIHLSPDGRFLYTSHRLKKDGIAIFKVDPVSGVVSAAGYQETGLHPRNFALTPDGRFLLCACRDSGRIEIYSIDASTGLLTPTGKSIDLPAPVCVQILP